MSWGRGQRKRLPHSVCEPECCRRATSMALDQAALQVRFFPFQVPLDLCNDPLETTPKWCSSLFWIEYKYTCKRLYCSYLLRCGDFQLQSLSLAVLPQKYKHVPLLLVGSLGLIFLNPKCKCSWYICFPHKNPTSLALKCVPEDIRFFSTMGSQLGFAQGLLPFHWPMKLHQIFIFLKVKQLLKLRRPTLTGSELLLIKNPCVFSERFE